MICQWWPEANNWFARHKQITILHEKHVQWLFHHLVIKFVSILKVSLCLYSGRSTAIFYPRVWLQLILQLSRILFAALTHLDGTHGNTIICRLLFVGQVNIWITTYMKEGEPKTSTFILLVQLYKTYLLFKFC